MNRDEAEKCLQVARRLLAQADTSDADAADAALDRAMKYAEKGKRLDADAAGAQADALVAEIRARKRSGARGGSSGGSSARSRAPPPGGGGASTARPRGASSPASAPDAAPPPSRVRGTPEQEALIAKVRKAGGDYYAILGVPRGAAGDEAKKAYRKLALKLHPDKCKATGAEEVFKSVSRAFACLSDDDKRAAYDRYGTEDPSSLGRGGGPRGPGGFGGRPFYAEEEIDPSEIFNMFFGGGFAGGPGVRYRHASAHNRARMAREQAARRAAYGGRGPRGGARRRGGGGGGGGDGRGDDPADVLRNLFQLLPLMLVFLMYFLAPGAEEHYQLHRSPQFRHEMRTSRLDQTFYVRSPEQFEDHFPPHTRHRRRVEQNVEMSHVSALESNCLYERQQQHRLLRVGNKKERERANQMELHSCVKLQKIRTKESELRGRAQRT
jgi:DnaJ family protein B protein 12